jgi:hypothetical protein
LAASQQNFQYFSYVDNDGVTWNKRGSNDPDCGAIDGRAAFSAVAGTPIWDRESRKMHTRKAVFQDPTTFRTKRCIIYTAAAQAAISGATTLAVIIPGEVAAVTYNLSAKIDEKKPVAKASRNLADHA